MRCYYRTRSPWQTLPASVPAAGTRPCPLALPQLRHYCRHNVPGPPPSSAGAPPVAGPAPPSWPCRVPLPCPGLVITAVTTSRHCRHHHIPGPPLLLRGRASRGRSRPGTLPAASECGVPAVEDDDNDEEGS